MLPNWSTVETTFNIPAEEEEEDENDRVGSKTRSRSRNTSNKNLSSPWPRLQPLIPVVYATVRVQFSVKHLGDVSESCRCSYSLGWLGFCPCARRRRRPDQAGEVSLPQVVEDGGFVEEGEGSHVLHFAKFGRVHLLDVVFVHRHFMTIGELHQHLQHTVSKPSLSDGTHTIFLAAQSACATPLLRKSFSRNRPVPPEQQEDFEKFFTVFDGSSPEDVSHARQLWSSLSLMPPLESRLVSADIRQRLPVSRPQRSSTAAAAAAAEPPKPRAPEPPSVPALRQRQEERQRYAAMADQRKEILALLRRQREQRIQKELLSADFKPKITSTSLCAGCEDLRACDNL
ncbi:hypothetical protein INR49_019074 [Caranx melampygus]|nr:hypothetical protein INR49_019074 [Caranx melampygus]